MEKALKDHELYLIPFSFTCSHGTESKWNFPGGVSVCVDKCWQAHTKLTQYQKKEQGMPRLYAKHPFKKIFELAKNIHLLSSSFTHYGNEYIRIALLTSNPTLIPSYLQPPMKLVLVTESK